MHCSSCNLTVLKSKARTVYTSVLYFQKDTLSATANGDKFGQFLTLLDAKVNLEEELIVELLTVVDIAIYFYHNFNCISMAKSFE